MRRIIALAASLAAGRADAGLMTYTGTFNVTYDAPGLPSNVVGTFTFDFDEDLATGPGAQGFGPTLTSLTPIQIGATAFDITNTGLALNYDDGVFRNAILGGLDNKPGGGISVIYGDVDDFYFVFDGSSQLDGATLGDSPAYAVASGLGRGVAPSTGMITGVPTATVPEPSTIAGLGLGIVGAIGYGLRQRVAR